MMSIYDITIIVLYLLITLAVGIYSGKGIRNFREFAVGNQRFSFPIITMTVFASLIGGNSTVGTVERIYDIGIVFLLVPVASILHQYIMAVFIAPRFSAFSKHISLGDMLEIRFGGAGKIISGIGVSLLSAGKVATQFTAIGIIAQYITNIDIKTIIIVIGLIVIIYSSFGGVKSVVMTDVIQFIILIIALPMLSVLGVQSAGGVSKIAHELPLNFFQVDSKLFIQYSFIALIYMIPTLGPDIIQRMLLSKDTRILEKSFKTSALIEIPFNVVIIMIALSAIIIVPGINGNQVLPYYLDNLIPAGLKGLVVAGIMAVMMSTADTNLNSSTVFIVNDIVNPYVPRKIKQKHGLLISRILTAFIGLGGILIALHYKNILLVHLFSRAFWMPVILFPIYAVIFNLPGDKKDLYRAGVTGVCTFFLWQVFLEDSTCINPLLPSFLANVFVFLRGRVWLLFLNKEAEELGVSQKNKGAPLLNRIAEITKRAQAPYLQIAAFGIAMFTTPIFYVEIDNNYLHANIVRIFAAFIIFLIFFKEIIFKKNTKYFYVYWNLSLLVSFAITPLYFYLLDGRLTNYFILFMCFFVLMISLDYRIFLVHTIISLSFSIFFKVFSGNIIISKEIISILCLILVTNIINMLIFRYRLLAYEEKVEIYKENIAKIAHEMKPPLQSVLMHIKNVDGSNKKWDAENLYKASNIIANTFKFINVTLLTVLNKRKSIEKHSISIDDFVKSFLDSFPFDKDYLRENLYIKKDKNKIIRTQLNMTELKAIVHNIVRNSYQSISEKGEKGKIELFIQNRRKEIIIKIKDNGCGMTALQLHKIFDPFYTTKEYGVGVGLAYCKEVIERADGNIFCESKKNVGTTMSIMIRKK